MTTLVDVTSPRSLGDGVFSWTVPAGWGQGRGAYGGLVLAALVRALEHGAPEGMPLRTLTATLCGPSLVGEARITVRLLRQGSGTWVAQADLTQGEELRVHAVGIFGKRRVDDGTFDDLAGNVPDPAAYPEVPIEPPLAPEFSQHYAFRLVAGFPFSGSTERSTRAFVRCKAPGEPRDAAFIAAHADACWPTVLVTQTRPRPTATISFTLDLVGDLDGLDPDAPLLHEATCTEGRDGYLVEHRTLRGVDGRIVARNTQTFVLIK